MNCNATTMPKKSSCGFKNQFSTMTIHYDTKKTDCFLDDGCSVIEIMMKQIYEVFLIQKKYF